MAALTVREASLNIVSIELTTVILLPLWAPFGAQKLSLLGVTQ